MDAEVLFRLFNLAVIPAWILLAFFPDKELTVNWVRNYRYPLFLAIFYMVFIVFGMIANRGGDGGMSSMEELRISFENDMVLLAAWIHYLVFDMVVGILIVKGFEKHKMNKRLLPLFLFPTLMLGPIGFLAYHIYKSLRSK